MDIIESQASEFKNALRSHAAAYQLALAAETVENLAAYFSLITKWNARLHLVSFASPQEFATRHVLESLVLLKYLQSNSSVADVGSGGGLPIIPCLIARKDIRAVLIESSKKKATLLREAVRRTRTDSRSQVIPERFENLPPPAAHAVTCRALEKFASSLPRLAAWAPPTASLLFFGGENLGAALTDLQLGHQRILLPNSERRYLFVIAPRN
ncbi:MAG TPA: RsmG family class I SAM-dependent methyltransferase [Pyrinomonadaceae bacterium]|nr:RsmG family class I SAM-dependent methyltransferase [Pyrinomonadaceae bacterium]